MTTTDSGLSSVEMDLAQAPTRALLVLYTVGLERLTRQPCEGLKELVIAELVQRGVLAQAQRDVAAALSRLEA